MTATAERPAGLADPPLRAPIRWSRPAVAALLTATAALYLWNLSANGYANAFYAAAAQAGSQSWSGWFFGSLDAKNFITVDKPPAALWVTGLSVRLFGMSSWTVLVPQVLMGVATVAVLYAAVRRSVDDAEYGAAAGLLAGTVLALTPVSALIFRYNNPDALMVLLTTVAAYCLLRALAAASWRWLAMVGVAFGFAFLTKMLAGLIVLSAFVVAYLCFAPTHWWKRLVHLLIPMSALVVSAGWWVLTVQLWPADARPYIGGSTDNSVLNLALGYNGVSRIFGSKGPIGQPIPHTVAASRPGLHRLFGAEMGYEISWLLPVALFALAFGGYLLLRASLSRSEKAALVLWGGWIALCALVFGYMNGTAHPYYTVAMAPAVGALVGLGTIWAWRRRRDWDGRIALAAIISLAAGWAAVLLHRADLGPTWARSVVIGGAFAAIALLATTTKWPTLAPVAVTVGLIAGLGGTAAFTVATIATPHDGAVPSAVHTANGWPTVGKRFGSSPSLRFGNLADNNELAAALRATTTPWSAATTGSQGASALEIASGTSVMAIGGWSSDPVPTLPQFIADVRGGKITYYVDIGHNHTRSTAGGAINQWVEQTFRPTLIGGARVYRLS